MEYQLPRAVINVKQGAGRLIRDETDRGVLMICDPRLLSKPYGRRVWQSLPPMKRTKELSEVLKFFRQPMKRRCFGKLRALEQPQLDFAARRSHLAFFGG
jgi:Rad3-related DNA helicase